jgi:hypothetical protein
VTERYDQEQERAMTFQMEGDTWVSGWFDVRSAWQRALGTIDAQTDEETEDGQTDTVEMEMEMEEVSPTDPTNTRRDRDMLDMAHVLTYRWMHGYAQALQDTKACTEEDSAWYRAERAWENRDRNDKKSGDVSSEGYVRGGGEGEGGEKRGQEGTKGAERAYGWVWGGDRKG